MSTKNFNQPLQINLNAADDMVAEVKMTQMHFNKMQSVCFKRCIGRISDSFGVGVNKASAAEGSTSGDSSNGSADVVPVIAELSKAENVCIDRCVQKYFQTSEIVTKTSQVIQKQQIEEYEAWGTGTKIVVGTGSAVALGGLAWWLFRD